MSFHKGILILRSDPFLFLFQKLICKWLLCPFKGPVRKLCPFLSYFTLMR